MAKRVASGEGATSFRNLQPDVVRRIIKSMDGKTAARFAAVSKEYSANALAQVPRWLPILERTAKSLAGELTRAVAHIRKQKRDRVFDNYYREVPDSAVLGKLEVFGYRMFPERFLAGRVVLEMSGDITGGMEVRRAGGHYILKEPGIGGWGRSNKPAARLYFVLAVVLRATELYNRHPVAVWD